MNPVERNKRILLVDDDVLTNMINTKLITRNFNFDVESYTDSQKALLYLKTLEADHAHIPDIIFLDINMTIMDGWEFIEAFQEFPASILNKCKVYMLSSSIDADDIEKSKTYPMVSGFISKPLTVDKMRQCANPE